VSTIISFTHFLSCHFNFYQVRQGFTWSIGTTNLLLLLLLLLLHLLLLPVSEFWLTFWQLFAIFFDNFITTFFYNFLTIFDNFITTFWQLFDNFWQLYNNFLTTVLRFFDNFWQLNHNFLNTFQKTTKQNTQNLSIFAQRLNYAQFFLYFSILSQQVSELFSSCYWVKTNSRDPGNSREIVLLLLLSRETASFSWKH
jgi:hypothetical protein